jgi:hypothetical protein
LKLLDEMRWQKERKKRKRIVLGTVDAARADKALSLPSKNV